MWTWCGSGRSATSTLRSPFPSWMWCLQKLHHKGDDPCRLPLLVRFHPMMRVAPFCNQQSPADVRQVFPSPKLVLSWSSDHRRSLFGWAILPIPQVQRRRHGFSAHSFYWDCSTASRVVLRWFLARPSLNDRFISGRHMFPKLSSCTRSFQKKLRPDFDSAATLQTGWSGSAHLPVQVREQCTRHIVSALHAWLSTKCFAAHCSPTPLSTSSRSANPCGASSEHSKPLLSNCLQQPSLVLHLHPRYHVVVEGQRNRNFFLGHFLPGLLVYIIQDTLVFPFLHRHQDLHRHTTEDHHL